MKGIYLLEIVVEQTCELRIGSLGWVAFPRGSYVYVGSAQNSLEKRIARHCRERKKRRWHIDYLLSAGSVSVSRALYAEGDKSKECELARLLAAAAEPVRGFGSSDCTCASHLSRIAGLHLEEGLLGGLCWREALARRAGRPPGTPGMGGRCERVSWYMVGEGRGVLVWASTLD